jgi:hypothetical protein
MNGDAAVPVTAEVLMGPLVAEVRLNISAEAQLAVRCGKPVRTSQAAGAPHSRTPQADITFALWAACPDAGACSCAQAVARCRLR